MVKYRSNGHKNGPGKFYNKDGRLVYNGMWECGEPHGQGILYDKNNTIVYNGFMNKGKTSGENYGLYINNKTHICFNKEIRLFLIISMNFKNYYL